MSYSIVSHTAYSIQHTAYSIQHTAYSIQHTAYSIQHTAYSIQHTAQSDYSSEIIVHRFQLNSSTVHGVIRTVHDVNRMVGASTAWFMASSARFKLPTARFVASTAWLGHQPHGSWRQPYGSGGQPQAFFTPMPQMDSKTHFFNFIFLTKNHFNTMAKRDYIPGANGDKAVWAQNLLTKIGTVGPTIGLTAGEITDLETAAQDMIDAVNSKLTAKANYESASSAASQKMKIAEDTIRPLVKRGKTSSAYNDAIGQNLRWVGDENSIDPNTAQPQIRLTKSPEGWRIDFNLRDFFDGVNIYRQLPGEAFKFLTYDTSNPYIDTFGGLSVGVRYYAFYVINEQEVGLQSNIAEITI